MTIANNHDTYAWWAALKHGGLLIAPAKLRERFEDAPAPLPFWVVDRLRGHVNRLRTDDRAAPDALLTTVFDDVLGLEPARWLRGRALDGDWSIRLVTGEAWRPRAVYAAEGGLHLPLFVVPVGEVGRIGVGRGRRAVARTVEWLRKANQKIALLTNGRQWRLIHAGSDYEAWCEWEIEQWFEQGGPGAQLTALRQLLGVAALSAAEGATAALPAAIEASRTGQAELSQELGERVRQAVELLIRACAPAIDALRHDHPNVTAQHLYIAANRVVMRCVIILFAEARELLPTDNPIYHNSYGLNGLREQLDRQAGGQPQQRLANQHGAWPRLLALFRLIDAGSAHPQLPVRAYGGRLFAPGDAAAADPVRRALLALEQPHNGPGDAAVYRLLQLLTQSRVRVRQGRSSTWVNAPVDFSDLSSEYIGILYQGLLDFELRRATDEPIIFLNLGDQPALPLTRLQTMDDDALAALVEKLKKGSKPSVSRAEVDEAREEDEDDEEAGDADDADDETADDADADADDEETDDAPPDDEPADDNDLIAAVRAQAQAWAERAVVVGKLVRAPATSASAEQQALYAAEVQALAAKLIARVVLPDEWFLVRWGGTRKGSGTFYTRPQLGVPLVRRTLQPLCYDGDGAPLPPEVILARKVCDSAMGSGSLLAAALRYLTDALFESLYWHGRIAAHADGARVRLADGQTSDDVLDESLPLPPDHPEFDAALRARLKRYVVERCLYGVDLDPLAVELARLTLWIETMDRTLPFGFLDHKLKVGNALVGCWLDRFQDYPVMAWEREGGDQKHDRFVHHCYETTITRGKRKGETERRGDRWTAEIKRIKSDVIRGEMQTWITALGTQMMRFGADGLAANQVHADALASFEGLHALPVHASDERARRYRAQIVDNPAWRQLKQAFDTWCAVWFWPGDALDQAPTPANWHNPPPETAALVAQVAARQRFFHWELEFPDVFHPQRAGFDALIKNPPWDILKPKSQEFFSNIDPLYRTYTKQEALRRQGDYFTADAQIEHDWLQYNADFRAMSNWSKYAAWPFGDADGASFSFTRGKENAALHRLWAQKRRARTGYADPAHPFRHQGSADLNSYKMFLEQCYRLARPDGWLGVIVPSGLSSDKGTGDLRELFLNQSRWEWLFGFENKYGIFDIHRSFKFYTTILQKGGQTDAIRAAFMRHALGDWAEAEQHVLRYPRRRIQAFSPNTGAILEIRSQQDLRVLEKLYANGVLLGDQGPDGWGIKYATEFHMTNDSKLFPPRSKWEQDSYIADEYGHWLKGRWQPAPADVDILARDRATILSADGRRVIAVEDMVDVALPLYEGRMIGQFDFSQKGWVSGKGRTAVWREISFGEKVIEPQYLMSLKSLDQSGKGYRDPKIAYMRIGSATNARSVTASYLRDQPAGDSVFFFRHKSSDLAATLLITSFFDSLVYDYSVRVRLGGLNLSEFLMVETPALKPQVAANNRRVLLELIMALGLPHKLFAREWLTYRAQFGASRWQENFALTWHERLRLRAIHDAIHAHLYGLSVEDLAFILADCDWSKSQLSDSNHMRTLDPKGFWRVDKDKDPELRHTVLSLVAFHDLQARGLDAFLAQHDGDGWHLPETLRLADYGLGHDERARVAQPVAGRLGPRWLPWQLAGSPADSWAACERHAENLRLLLGDTVRRDEVSRPDVVPRDLFGQPVQTDLFGNVVPPTEKRTR